MRTVPLAQPEITTPMPDGPGFPRQPPSTNATSSDLTSILPVAVPLSAPLLRSLKDAPFSIHRQDDYLVRFHRFAACPVAVHLLCKRWTN
jgi:hypothetical protein